MTAASTGAAVGRLAAFRGQSAKAREVVEEAEGGSAKQVRAVLIERVGREGERIRELRYQ